jgi:hypothetical protein
VICLGTEWVIEMGIGLVLALEEYLEGDWGFELEIYSETMSGIEWGIYSERMWEFSTETESGRSSG